VWARDASKQAIGALVAHGWNLLFALFLQTNEDENPCVFYFINFMIDALLGCILNFLFLYALEKIATRWKMESMRSGDYGYPPKFSYWLIQTSAWIIAITVVKFVLLFCVIVPFKDPLYAVGAWLMSGFEPYPKLELIIVMIIIPLVMNIIVFWIQDNFLMDHHQIAHYRRSTQYNKGDGKTNQDTKRKANERDQDDGGNRKNQGENDDHNVEDNDHNDEDNDHNNEDNDPEIGDSNADDDNNIDDRTQL